MHTHECPAQYFAYCNAQFLLMKYVMIFCGNILLLFQLPPKIFLQQTKGYTHGVVTKTRNRMELNGLFRSVLFRTLCLETILYPALNPKTFDFGISNPK